MRNYERVKSDPVSAQLYTNRKPRKHQFEMEMVSEAFQMLPAAEVKTVLDAPCGVGRLSLWLAQKGFEVSAVDLGESAVQLTNELLRDQNFKETAESQDVFNMRFEDGAFDVSVCFRLLHHFKDVSDQQKLVAELCRVSSKYVVISYFSTYSVTSLRRRLRRTMTGEPIKQNPMSLAQLEGLFEPQQFELLGTVKRSGFLHSLQVAVFTKRVN
ncbi:MAG: 2-polyprenyl-3-methyl-5-hydroxy-6-metoxy-1,4-benzoquinol methylase [Pseudohongiellaceae bacterium]|jgi:2-polyprenyl-3-methyl-5-hydroxy-6-metoxy-1,4-benzoquinol methylase